MVSQISYARRRLAKKLIKKADLTEFYQLFIYSTFLDRFELIQSVRTDRESFTSSSCVLVTSCVGFCAGKLLENAVYCVYYLQKLNIYLIIKN